LDGARKMLGGNDGLLRKLLEDFRKKYLDYGTQIGEALEAGDHDLAKRTAHSLKGVSGNIRATEVFAAAKALDDLLRESPESDDVPPQLSKLNDELAAIGRSLDDAFGRTSTDKDNNKTDTVLRPAEKITDPVIREKSAKMIAELQNALERGDVSAETILQDLIQTIDKEYDDLTELSRLVEDLEYESALEVCKRLEKRLGF
jgi:HPt (histidine-containing phosphotransfer) domain-containing protein